MKLQCPCGYVFDDQDGEAWMAFMAYLVEPAMVVPALVEGKPLSECGSRQLWRCPECPRIAIETAPESLEMTIYLPEQPRGVN